MILHVKRLIRAGLWHLVPDGQHTALCGKQPSPLGAWETGLHVPPAMICAECQQRRAQVEREHEA